MSDALAPTLGPAGTPVLVEGNVRNKVDLIDDAATVARRILSLGDPRLDIGAMIVRNVVWRVSQRAGDGGATAAVLLNAIRQGGERQITVGPMPCSWCAASRLGYGSRHYRPPCPGPTLRRRDAAGGGGPHGHP